MFISVYIAVYRRSEGDGGERARRARQAAHMVGAANPPQTRGGHPTGDSQSLSHPVTQSPSHLVT
eukprot:9444071-Pyramimonas_sp.AAC.1